MANDESRLISSFRAAQAVCGACASFREVESVADFLPRYFPKYNAVELHENWVAGQPNWKIFYRASHGDSLPSDPQSRPSTKPTNQSRCDQLTANNNRDIEFRRAVSLERNWARITFCT